MYKKAFFTLTYIILGVGIVYVLFSIGRSINVNSWEKDRVFGFLTFATDIVGTVLIFRYSKPEKNYPPWV